MDHKKATTVKLRGHHLICLNFFSGEGYSLEFVENLKEVTKKVEDTEVEICQGPDDVCKKCPYLKEESCYYDEDADEEIKAMDDKALSLLNLLPGSRIRWYQISKRLPEIFGQWYESFCKDCDWRLACEKNSMYRSLKTSTLS